MSISNARSDFIDIFPISIDRLSSRDVYIRIYNYKTLTISDETAADESTVDETLYGNLTSADQEYVDKNPIIFDMLDDNKDYFKLYEPKTIGVSSSSAHGGRELTEYNFSSILTKLTSHDSFVIDKQEDYIEFMIKGHYFKVKDDRVLKNYGDDTDPDYTLYVGITFINEASNFETLFGYDITDNGVSIFANVDFSNSPLYTNPLTAPSRYTGKIYHKVLHLLDNDGNVPTNSYFRFDSKTIENINGGTV